MPTTQRKALKQQRRRRRVAARASNPHREAMRLAYRARLLERGVANCMPKKENEDESPQPAAE